MTEIQSMKHYNAIPILRVCPGKLTKVLRQEEVTNLEEKIVIRKSLFTPMVLDQEMSQTDGKKKAHFELRVVKLCLTKIGCELLDLSTGNLHLNWQFMNFPESTITSSNFKNDTIEFDLSVLYKIEDYDSFSKDLEIYSVKFSLFVVKEENYIKMGCGQTVMSRALSSPKSKIVDQVSLFHQSENREDPILLANLNIWYSMDFGKHIVSNLNIFGNQNWKADLFSLYSTPKSLLGISTQSTKNSRSSKESILSANSEFSQFFDVDVTDSEVKGFQEALFLVLNRNKALKTTQSEISRELKDRAEWLNEEAIWRRTLQEYAILSGKHPSAVQWRQWRDENTSQVLLRSFPIKPPFYEPTLKITICHVQFLPHSKPYESDSIYRIYVEYPFLQMDGPEMEAEESLPIPPPNTEITFNFEKSYNIDLRKNRPTCNALSNLIKDRIPLRISVVGEPKPRHEELIQTCTEIGYSEVDFFEVVQLETNKELLDYHIYDSDTWKVIGTMAVEISGILAMRKMALLILAPDDYNLIV